MDWQQGKIKKKRNKQPRAKNSNGSTKLPSIPDQQNKGSIDIFIFFTAITS